METLFWASLGLIFYTYFGFALLAWTVLKLKGKRPPLPAPDDAQLPTLTLIVACYNEADLLDAKVSNTLSLKYPKDKLSLLFVTDGSTDQSAQILSRYPEIKHYHEDARNGKNHAVNRIIPFVQSDVIVFCDANTSLNKDALINIARHYADPKVGAVAGEKRVGKATDETAAASGEGAYWKYESALKKIDSNLATVVGAAGELFSVRANLYEAVPTDIIIEDFYLSMRIVEKGYRVVYEPDAYAQELGSASMEEEGKRKIRIAAGGLQAIARLTSIWNIFRHGWATYLYASHRVFRWTITPAALLILIVVNTLLVLRESWNSLFGFFLVAQVGFYLLALIGHFMQTKLGKLKVLLLPYYFTFMNICVYLGFLKLLRGKQSAVWEKAKRQE
jgi:poly-beta-1,6-N-acetyl-D-glucosamine synthase